VKLILVVIALLYQINAYAVNNNDRCQCRVMETQLIISCINKKGGALNKCEEMAKIKFNQCIKAFQASAKARKKVFEDVRKQFDIEQNQ